MTDEERQKAMEFMLEQQAKHESEIQDLRAVNKTIQENQQRFQENQQKLQEGQQKFEENQQKLQESQQALTNSLITLVLQADQDHSQLSASLTAVNTALIRLEVVVEKDREETKIREAQADKDRVEMRAKLDQLEAQANKDRQAMAATVDKLIGAISNVHGRVSRLEDQSSQ